MISGICEAQWLRRLPSVPFSPGSNLGGDSFFFLICFFFFICFIVLLNLLLFFLNWLFFEKFTFFFVKFTYLFIFLINFKGLCHGFLFLHKSRSSRTPIITLRVNSFFYCFSSMFPPFIVSGRACMTISCSTLALARSAKNIKGRRQCILHVTSERWQ